MMCMCMDDMHMHGEGDAKGSTHGSEACPNPARMCMVCICMVFICMVAMRMVCMCMARMCMVRMCMAPPSGQKLAQALSNLDQLGGTCMHVYGVAGVCAVEGNQQHRLRWVGRRADARARLPCV